MKKRSAQLELLAQIVDREQERLFRFASLRTGSRADAEDIVQETLLRLLRSECDLSRIDDVERYLWRAIANRCTDYHRRRHAPNLPADKIADLPEETPDAELHEQAHRIARLLDTLPEPQAEVIRLKTAGSLTFARIAEVVGCPEATVKSRFRYGIGKLRERLAASEPSEKVLP